LFGPGDGVRHSKPAGISFDVATEPDRLSFFYIDDFRRFDLDFEDVRSTDPWIPGIGRVSFGTLFATGSSISWRTLADGATTGVCSAATVGARA
jgi:hypothetical protein